jgi:hypothetical protein
MSVLVAAAGLKLATHWITIPTFTMNTENKMKKKNQNPHTSSEQPAVAQSV